MALGEPSFRTFSVVYKAAWDGRDGRAGRWQRGEWQREGNRHTNLVLPVGSLYSFSNDQPPTSSNTQ